MVGKYLPAPKIQSTKRKCVTKSQNVASVCSVILSIEDCLRSVIHVRLVTMFLSKYVLIAISSTKPCLIRMVTILYLFSFAITRYLLPISKIYRFGDYCMWQSNNISINWWIHFNIIRYLVCTWTECLIKWLGGTEMWLVECYRRLKFNNHKLRR